ncbi:MAG: glycerol kinase GlpK [Bosea sp.]|uniref:glycerol kinase GlpK n=1 Tax=Bosea sp. (in: a-proteobacteria) TaxID=1871050 RepID=UPI001AC0FA07|nr:glycerol kinase GlpK [Bosea sp. (in: a-proteobacteria)]MBN9471840.1 glycerol kinase GlpK [Bosea sp. (in: a-proteobacteria)]
MAAGHLILAIDQGTTSSRAILFDAQLRPVTSAQQEFVQHYPASGWVEHEPEDLWESTLAVCREALAQARAGAGEVAAIGITNQRETTLIWDRRTGAAIHRAIVWQDRRTAERCAALEARGHGDLVAARTGLRLDPYFSGSKIAWILDNVPGARERAERGELAFGTVDSFLLWRLTGGRVHATDATNASRTMLFDIHRGEWDAELLALLDIPASLLPEVRDCAALFGETEPELFGGAIPIRGIAGDQQAATIGQACFSPGMLKSTYGTGCFALLNTGAKAVASQSRLLTTIAYQFGGERHYALEGSIFIAGAAVQWLRDGLGIIERASQSGPLAANADPGQQVYLVPAFTGLGAPHWDANARGAMFGLTRNTGPREFARAALEAVCFQTLDLLEAMRADWPEAEGAGTVLRVDGGMVASDWTMQRLADILSAPVDRPEVLETTALGAAYLAGLDAGLLPEPAQFGDRWRLERRFTPTLAAEPRRALVAGWRDAVRRTLSSA